MQQSGDPLRIQVFNALEGRDLKRQLQRGGQSK